MPPNERADLSAGSSAAYLDSTTAWYALAHAPRVLWVSGSGCGWGAPNQSNSLRRNGWQETASTRRRYRCGDCAEVVP